MKKLACLALLLFLSAGAALSQEVEEKLKKEGLELGAQLSPSAQVLAEEKKRSFETTPLTRIPLTASAYRVACNSNYCAFAQKDGKVSAYDLKNKSLILEQNFSRYPLYNVAFYPLKNIICFGDREGRVTFFDIDNKERIHTIYEFGNRISEARFSPDGKTLAVTYLDKGEINLYDTAEYKNLSTIKAHTEGIYYLAFSADGNLIASGSRDKNVSITPLTEKWPSQILGGHLFFVLSVDFSGDNLFLASGGGDGKLILWKKNQETIEKTPYFEWVHPGWVTAVKFFKDYLLTASKDGKIRIFDFRNKRFLGNFKCAENIFSLDITPQGEYLFVSTSKEILQYDFKKILERIAH